MNKEIREKRLKLVFIGLSFIALLILLRFAWIMLGPTELLGTEEIQLNRPVRGNIYDRNGNILAIETQLYSVSLWIPDIQNPEENSVFLADILSMDQKELLDMMENVQGSNFKYISRKVSPGQFREIESLKAQGKLQGINLEPEPGRLYPAREIAAHVLGYTGMDNVGLDGIEYTYNDLLSPPQIQSDPHQTQGNHVYLSLDLESQYLLEKSCKDSMEKYQPDILMALLMEARTGDILAYVSLPSFDPNHFDQYSADKRRDNISTTSYEPGSVFKIFSLSSALELNSVNPQMEFDTSGGYNPDFFQEYNIPPITDLGNYGVLNLEKILIYSSNVGTSYAIEGADNLDFYNMLKNFGFGQTVGIPLPGESNGLLNEPSTWS
nr:penicillin-binding transpeptidase domain-containing protein [Spirochaetaceae bacterium]